MSLNLLKINSSVVFSPRKKKLNKIYRYSPRLNKKLTINNIDKELPDMINIDYNKFKRWNNNEDTFISDLPINFIVKNPILFSSFINILFNYQYKYIDSFQTIDDFINNNESDKIVKYIRLITNLTYDFIVNNLLFTFYINYDTYKSIYTFITLNRDELKLISIKNNTIDLTLKNECNKILNCEY